MIIKKDLSRSSRTSDSSDHDVSFEQRRADRKRRRISYHFKGSVNTPTHQDPDDEGTNDSHDNKKGYNSTGVSKSKLAKRKISSESLRKSKINLDEKLKSVNFHQMENRKSLTAQLIDNKNITVRSNINYDSSTKNNNNEEKEDEGIQIIGNNENYQPTNEADDDSPHTPLEKEIPRPLVSPGFSLKRRSLVGEVIGSPRRLQRNTPNRLRSPNSASTAVVAATVNAVESVVTGNKKMENFNDGDNKENISAAELSKNITSAMINEFLEDDDDDENDFKFIESKSEQLLAIEGEEIKRPCDSSRQPEDVFYQSENKEISAETSHSDNPVSSPPEQLSRISIQENTTPDAAANMNEADDNETLNDQILLETPTRLTKSVAVSPSTEQKSRIIDDTDLLDTSQPVRIVNIESPLANHKSHGSLKKVSPIVHHLLDGTRTSSPSQNKMSPGEGRSPASIKKRQKLNRRKTMAMNFGDTDDLHNNDKDAPQSLNDEQSSILKELISLSNGDTLSNNQPDHGSSYVLKIQEQYNNIVKSLNAALDSKEAEVANMVESLSLSNMKLREIQQRLDETLTVDRQLLDRNEVLVVEVKGLYENIDILTNDIALKDEKLSKYQILGSKIKDIYNSQNARIHSLMSRNNKLSENIDDLSKEKSELQETITLSENKLRTTISELLENKEQHVMLNAKVEELQRSVDSELSKIVDLNTEIEGLHTENKKLKNELDDIRFKYEDENDLRKNLENEIKKYVIDEETLRGSNDTLKLEVENLKQKSNDLNEQRNSLFAENENFNKIIENNNSKLQDFEKELNELNDKYIESLKVTDSKLGDINDLNDKVSELNDKIKELEEANSTMNVDLNKERQVVTEIQEKLIESQRRVTVLNEKLEKLSDIDDMKTKKIKDLETQIDNLKTDSKKQIDDEVSRFKNELAIKEEELQNKCKKIDDSSNNEKLLQVEINDLKDQINKSKYEINMLKKEKTDLEAQTEDRLTRLSEDLYSQYSKKHEQKIGILKKGYEAKWQNKLSQMNNTNESLRREIEGLKEQLTNEKKEKAQFMKLWEKVVKMDQNK